MVEKWEKQGPGFCGGRDVDDLTGLKPSNPNTGSARVLKFLSGNAIGGSFPTISARAFLSWFFCGVGLLFLEKTIAGQIETKWKDRESRGKAMKKKILGSA